MFGFGKRAKFNFQMCVCLKAKWTDTRRQEGPLTTEIRNEGAF